MHKRYDKTWLAFLKALDDASISKEEYIDSLEEMIEHLHDLRYIAKKELEEEQGIHTPEYPEENKS